MDEGYGERWAQPTIGETADQQDGEDRGSDRVVQDCHGRDHAAHGSEALGGLNLGRQ